MKLQNEESLSFFPQSVLENIMMTSLLADKSVKLEITIILNFMNEIINPACNSLFLSTEFYQLAINSSN